MTDAQMFVKPVLNFCVDYTIFKMFEIEMFTYTSYCVARRLDDNIV